MTSSEDASQLTTKCPHCGARYRLARQALGRKVACRKCGKSFTVAPHASPPVKPEALSRCRYFTCTCGAIFEKTLVERKLRSVGGSETTDIGSNTCSKSTCPKCGAVLSAHDIYSGKHDVAAAYWPQLQRQTGMPVQVPSERDRSQSLPRSPVEYSMTSTDDCGEYALESDCGKQDVAEVAEFRLVVLDRDYVIQLASFVQKCVNTAIGNHDSSARQTVSGCDRNALYEGISFRDVWKGHDYLMGHNTKYRQRVEATIDNAASRIVMSAAKEDIESFVYCILNGDVQEFRAIYGFDKHNDEAAVATGLLTGALLGKNIWETWRNEIRRAPELRQVDLSRLQLSGARLNGANLVRADLSLSLGCEIDLAGADLTGANLRECWWWKPCLSRGTLCGADLTDAWLDGVQLSGDWSGATLREAVIRVEDIEQPVNLSGVDFTGCTIKVSGPVREELLQLLSPQQRAQVKLSRCFIATACCQDEDAWQVVALRRFRDQRLSRYSAGRRLISLYNALSPPLARAIDRRRWLQCLVRGVLITPAARLVSDRRMLGTLRTPTQQETHHGRL